MRTHLKQALVVSAVLIATHASAQITFYETENFGGRSFTTSQQTNNLNRIGFGDSASSAYVTTGRWEVCDDVRFNGRCVILRPGRYPSLQAMAMNDRISSVRMVAASARVDERRYAPPAALPQITFYENDNFQGRHYSTDHSIDDFIPIGFNDRASSVVVLGDRWEVCDDVRFKGRCMVLQPGRYPSLAAMGMNDRLSSVRAMDPVTRVDDRRLAPPPAPVYDNRRRNQERLYEVRISSVRAVVGQPEERCWMEREDVPATKGAPNMGGALVGGLIGGILGHQVGGGVGKDIATVGGAVAGAAVGANVGRNDSGQPATQRDVKRCATQPASTKPAFWDVSYNFRGQEHRVQMSTEPGDVITVNENGEPRSE
ncbi:beta/gamma crystallin-related protein [Rhodoferax sp. GW822-FHT02A01]|uniref:beta/gamma crystallin-related protein n=1 Tax=Rhodoferax sp. GW822-FHT02A01 TaxID=3141537 RepID=UPI00315C963E